MIEGAPVTGGDQKRPTRGESVVSLAERTARQVFVEPAVGFAMPAPLSSHASADEFLSALIGNELHTIVVNEQRARVGVDPDGIHQLRASARRLRCHLRHFRALLDPQWSEVTLRELRWFGTTLGVVRDLDVMRDVLSACAASLPTVDVQHLEPLFASITAQRIAAHATMHDALDSERYVSLLTTLSLAATNPNLTDDTMSGSELARTTASRAWSRLEKSVMNLGQTPTDADLHAVRLRAKRARFAAEAAIPFADPMARKLAKAMANVQTVLGMQHDAVVAHHWVRAHALNEERSVNFSAGMVAGLLRHASQQAAREFPEVWRKASRPKLRGWF